MHCANPEQSEPPRIMETPMGAAEDADPGNDTFVKLENAVKERKVHRNAADFDGKFIRDTMEEDEIPTEGV